MTYLIGNFNCRVHKLPVVSPVERHAMVPEMFEEMWQNLVHDILGLYTISSAALFYHLRTTKIIITVKNSQEKKLDI